MEITPKRVFTSPISEEDKQRTDSYKARYYLHLRRYQVFALLAVSTLLLSGVFLFSLYLFGATPADAAASWNCSWYRIRIGDTLSELALVNRTTVSQLAHANHLHNINLIIAGNSLCLSHSGKNTKSCNSSSCTANHASLQSASQGQVASQLRQAAAKYNLPISLLYAIAWEESGWNQRAISPDGGIGVMQLMPATASGLIAMSGTYQDPYLLRDNVNLGALYLHTLWINFHGNLPSIISAYNEGGWNVVHRGIFNWTYVNSVLALMRKYNY